MEGVKKEMKKSLVDHTYRYAFYFRWIWWTFVAYHVANNLAFPFHLYFANANWHHLHIHLHRDYSQVEITDLVDDYKGANEELFPSKLHEILSTPEYCHIITWRTHGRAWVVVNKPLFISVVLPKYFNHSNFESFNRSVNGWGFKASSAFVWLYLQTNFLASSILLDVCSTWWRKIWLSLLMWFVS